MRRFPLLSALLVALLGVARAWAGEVASPPATAPTVEEVAARLSSPDAKEQAQGEVLLVRALRMVPDRADYLVRLAAALRAQPALPKAEVAPPAVPAPAPTPAGQTGAGASPPDQEAQQEDQPQSVAPLAPADPAKPAQTATWTLRAWGVSVPEGGLGLAAPDVSKEEVPPDRLVGMKKLANGAGLVGGPLDRFEPWVDAAKRVANAEPLGDATFGLVPGELQEAHLGQALLYRCCTVPQKGGSWAVETRSIPAGLSLRARLDGKGLTLEPSWVTVAQPMPTEQTRPAAGVDPIELDRPDWSVSRVRLEVGLLETPGSTLLVSVPGLLPDAGRRLVLVLELKPKP